jgi:alanine racemase
VGIHLAAEHALQFQGSHELLETRSIALDLARRGIVVLGFSKSQQLDRIAHRVRGALQRTKVLTKSRALPVERLSLLGLLPDGRIFEFAIDLF